MQNLKILHLGKYYPPAPGGIESHVQTLARHQSRLGCKVKILCVNHADATGRDITHARFSPTRSLVETDGSVRVERVGRVFGVSRLEVCPTLLGKVRRDTRDADIVHLHTPNPLMLGAWWVAGAKEKPLVVTHHSDVIKQRFLHLLVAPIETKIYTAAKRILSDSPNYINGSLILQRYRQKVYDLPLGIDLDRYVSPGTDEQKEITQLKELHGSPLWLMVGRMTYYKGYHVALKALTRTEGKLVVVGSGPLEGELKQQAATLGVSERVVWRSGVSDSQLIALYHAATALWFPSVARSEAFGLVQVEAMACGCPVINTEIRGSGVSWVSQDGISGITVAVDDPQGFAAAATRLANDQSLRDDLSKRARKRAIDLFEASQMAEKSLNIYSSILARV